MKKLVVILVIAFSSLSLAACGRKESSNTTFPSTVCSSLPKKETISELGVKLYLEKMTGKIILVDQYEKGSNSYISQLLEAQDDVNDTIDEIKEGNYSLSTAEASGALLDLSETVNSLIDAGINGNYDEVYELSKTMGSKVNQITNDFGDGELPPTINSIVK